MRDLTEGNIYKTFFLFAIPLVLSGVLSQGYSIINTVIAGKLLDDTGLAAIGATSALDTFINSVFWGYAAGLGIYTANLFGAGKYYRIRAVVFNNILFSALALITVCAALLLLRKPIYDMLCVDNAIREQTDIYFIICTAGKVLVVLQTYFLHITNSMGDSLFPLILSVISALINIGGNLLMVAVFEIGVAGLAISTVTAAAVVDICYMIKLHLCYKKLGAAKHAVHIDMRCIKKTLTYSLPTMLQQSVMYFSSFILSPLINGLGYAATASYTVILRIYQTISSIYQNASKTVSTYIAQCVGAGKHDTVKKGLLVGLMQSLIYVLPLVLACVIFPKQISLIFFSGEYSQVTLDHTVTFLRFYMPFILVNLVANLFHNFFRGLAYMKPLVIATAIGSVTQIAVSFILAPTLGIHGIFTGWVAAWLADGVFGMLLYLLSNWEKNSVKV